MQRWRGNENKLAISLVLWFIKFKLLYIEKSIIMKEKGERL